MRMQYAYPYTNLFISETQLEYFMVKIHFTSPLMQFFDANGNIIP